MPDLNMRVQISRDQLGLEVLDLNDHLNYYCATQFLGAAEEWSRTQATSPFVHGAVTIFRTRQNVSEPIGLEVRGADTAQASANLAAAVAAFSQDNFALIVLIEGVLYTYACEAADYQVLWTGPRWMTQSFQVIFTVPRKPNAAMALV